MPVAYRLYLPESWARIGAPEKTGVPEQIVFKPSRGLHSIKFAKR